MDDWVILAPTRWSLRRAVRMVNQTLQELRVEQHPDKPFVGQIERGFTFLAYWITEKGVTGVEPSTWEAFQERVARLYEQNAPQEEILRRIEQYVRRWKGWVWSGLGDDRSTFEWPDVVGGLTLPVSCDRGGDWRAGYDGLFVVMGWARLTFRGDWFSGFRVRQNSIIVASRASVTVQVIASCTSASR
jgi:hypothetical protein